MAHRPRVISVAGRLPAQPCGLVPAGPTIFFGSGPAGPCRSGILQIATRTGWALSIRHPPNRDSDIGLHSRRSGVPCSPHLLARSGRTAAAPPARTPAPCPPRHPVAGGPRDHTPAPPLLPPLHSLTTGTNSLASSGIRRRVGSQGRRYSERGWVGVGSMSARTKHKTAHSDHRLRRGHCRHYD
jgi:hypothetical protein